MRTFLEQRFHDVSLQAYVAHLFGIDGDIIVRAPLALTRLVAAAAESMSGHAAASVGPGL